MKGVITDIKDNRAVLLKSDGTFEEIKNKNYVIGQEIEKAASSVKKQLYFAACLALTALLSFGGVYAYRTPVEYIYVDINPSLRLDINMFHRVISIKSLNEDGENIEAFNKKPEKCVEEIIDECIEKGYLNDNNNNIEITVSDTKNGTGNMLKEECEKYSKHGYSVVVESAEKQEVEYANSHGISAGKHESKNKNAEKQVEQNQQDKSENGGTSSEVKENRANTQKQNTQNKNKKQPATRKENGSASKPDETVRNKEDNTSHDAQGADSAREERAQLAENNKEEKQDVSPKEKQNILKEEKREQKLEGDSKVKEQKDDAQKHSGSENKSENGNGKNKDKKEKGNNGKSDEGKENKKEKEISE